MWIAGGQVNIAGGLEIIKGKEFQDFAKEYFLDLRFVGLAKSILPSMAATIPQTIAEWTAFVTHGDRLIVVLGDTVEETVKGSTLPTPAVCSKIMKRLDDAERFDEEEIEMLEDDIDIKALNNIQDPMQIPGELEFRYGVWGCIYGRCSDTVQTW